jgi:hypothetical protein
MAAVDKIYGTRDQYDELWFYVANQKPEYLNYFYTQYYETTKSVCAIALFPEEVDRWLLKNCPLQWVKDYIKDQYCLHSTNLVYDFLNKIGEFRD